MLVQYKESLNERNCNARLAALYTTRDAVSAHISSMVSRGCDTLGLEAEYAEIIDTINELCIWRSNHPGCLLEGDPGYGLEMM